MFELSDLLKPKKLKNYPPEPKNIFVNKGTVIIFNPSLTENSTVYAFDPVGMKYTTIFNANLYLEGEIGPSCLDDINDWIYMTSGKYLIKINLKTKEVKSHPTSRTEQWIAFTYSDETGFIYATGKNLDGNLTASIIDTAHGGGQVQHLLTTGLQPVDSLGVAFEDFTVFIIGRKYNNKSGLWEYSLIDIDTDDKTSREVLITGIDHRDFLTGMQFDKEIQKKKGLKKRNN